MIKASILFLSFLLAFSSCSRSFLQNSNKGLVEKNVHFVLDVFAEPPSSDSVFRNDKGLSFFGYGIPSFSNFNTSVQEILHGIKLASEKLPEGLKSARNLGVATALDSTDSAKLYEKILQNLFPESLKKSQLINLKPLSRQNSRDLLYENPDDQFDLYQLSKDWFQKRIGLNLNLETCPQMSYVLSQKSKNNTKDFFELLNDIKDYDLLKKISKTFKSKAFAGSNNLYSWIFSGSDQPLLTSIHDLYNYVQSLSYDYLNGNIIKNRVKNYTALYNLRLAIVNYAFPDLANFIGKNFNTFLYKLISTRNSIVKQKNPQNIPRSLRNFLAIGSSPLNKDMLIGYFMALLGKTTKTTLNKSLILVLKGGKEIDEVVIYLNGSQVGSLPFKVIENNSMTSEEEQIESTKKFDLLCFGKTQV